MKWKVMFGCLVAILAWSSSVSAQAVSGYAQRAVERSYSHSGAPLLKRFYLRFTAGDHEIRGIGIRPDEPFNNDITIVYTDEGGDDEFFYNVAHHSVGSGSGAHRDFFGTEVCVGSCTRAIARPPGDHVFVLVGFYVYYNGVEHHIDQLEIREENGFVTVAFNDKDNNDTFFWELDYAYVPRNEVQSLAPNVPLWPMWLNWIFRGSRAV